MRIDEVREGKVAAIAGIEKGDVVFKMGQREIAGMNTCRETLRAFKPWKR